MEKKIIIFWFIIFCLMVAVCGFYYLNVNYNIGLICIFHKTTGLYCAGCGMTRAVLSLLELEFYQAFRYNIFSILVFPIVVLYFLSWLYSSLFNKPNFMDKKIPSVVWIIFIVGLLIYGVLRNIPQFSYLAPTVV